MSDKPRRDIPETGSEAPKDAISMLIQELGISPEVEKMIRALEWEEKERCVLAIEDIAIEAKEKNIGNADREKKITETLASEYGIALGKSTWTNKNPESLLSRKAEWAKSFDETGIRSQKLKERLEKVKTLDSAVVDDELKKAKSTIPLPEDIKASIAKNTGIPPGQIDTMIASGSNPQVTNLVDTFYLTDSRTETAIKSRLPEWKAWVGKAFSDLRASARELGVLAPFRSKDIEQYIADKPDKTQRMVLDASKAITGGRWDIPVERRGETLIFKSLDGKEVTHTIDMERRPPRVMKIRGILSVTQDIPDTAEQERQAKIKWDLESVKFFNTNKEREITDLYKSIRPNLSAINQQELSLVTIDEYMTTLRSKDANLDQKKEACERLVPLYEKAAYSDIFRPQTRMEWEEIKIAEGLTDYFSGEKVNIIELQKKYTEQSRLEKIYNPNPKIETSSENFEANTRQNLNGLAWLWITQFRSIDEVYAFLMSQNGPEIGNRWLTPEDINSSLGKEKIEWQQWEKMLKNLGVIQDTISWTEIDKLTSIEKSMDLMRSESNGVPKIINSLRKYSIENNGWSILNKDNFTYLMKSPSQKTPEKI